MKILSLEGKNAVVVGCGGLGLGAAIKLAKAGVSKLIVTNRSLEKAEKSAAAIREAIANMDKKPEIIAMAVDVVAASSENGATTNPMFVEALKKKMPEDIDLLLVTSGGVGGSIFGKRDAPFPKPPTSPASIEGRKELGKLFEKWSQLPTQAVFDLNCHKPVELIRLLSPRLAMQDRPPIVMVVGSVSPQLSGVEDYAAAKVALAEHVKRMFLNLGFARRQYGLEPGRAINIIWGFTESDQMRNLVWKSDGSLTYRGEGIMNATPLGDFATAEVFGRTVVDAYENPYINGNHRVDGGYGGAVTI